jgi:cell division protein FtsL
MSAARNFTAYNYDQVMHREIITKACKIEKSHAIDKKKISWINRLMALIMIIVVFGSMAYVLIRYAEINEIKYRNFSLKQEIEELNIQVEELQLKVESAMNLETIEQYAVNKLSMQYPEEKQMVYLQTTAKYALNDIEKSTDLVDNETIVVETVDIEDQGFFAMIFDTFGN